MTVDSASDIVSCRRTNYVHIAAPSRKRAGAVVMSEPRGGAMSDEPTTEQVTRALADNLPEWR